MATGKNGPTRKNKKLVIVGDGMCGKTCLLFAFKDDRFLPTHDATIFDTYVADIQVDGKIIDLALFDTAGQEDFDRLRPLSYPETNVILVCFSVDSPGTAKSVMEKWMPEVRHFCGRCPVILVACKKDLRHDAQTLITLKQDDERPVTSDVGRQIAAKIEADAYMECSAKTREGVHELFVHAARLSLKKRSSSHRASHRCSLL